MRDEGADVQVVTGKWSRVPGEPPALLAEHLIAADFATTRGIYSFGGGIITPLVFVECGIPRRIGFEVNCFRRLLVLFTLTVFRKGEKDVGQSRCIESPVFGG